MTIRFEGSLLDWLRQHPPGTLSPQEITHFIRQAAGALQSAHDHQVIYQRVAPSNFRIRTNSEHSGLPDLQLTDPSQATSPAGLPNVPSAIAPEQWRGAAVPATDQYALAVMAYQLLTSQSPFQGNQEQQMQQHLNVQPQPASRLNPRIPPGVDAVILRALAKKPEERFPSISAFADAFQQAAQAPGPIPTPQNLGQTPPASNLQSAGINRVQHFTPMRELLLLGLVFIIVVSGIGFGFYFIVKSNQAAAAHLLAATSTTTSGAASTLTATLGAPILEDSLSSNTNGRWPENATCLFKGGTYHVLVPQAGSISICTLQTFSFDNVAIQVDISLLSGTAAGFFFRFRGSLFYLFNIINQGGFALGSQSQSGDNPLIQSGQSNALPPGSAKNTVLLIANGSDFKLYINNIFVGQAHDSTSSGGQFGFLVHTDPSTAYGEGSFSNLKVFRLR